MLRLVCFINAYDACLFLQHQGSLVVLSTVLASVNVLSLLSRMMLFVCIAVLFKAGEAERHSVPVWWRSSSAQRQG